MKYRWEVTESQWVAAGDLSGDAPVDFVRIDLGAAVERAWLAAALDRVEVVGDAGRGLDPGLLERALDLDVDFLLVREESAALDPRRLPLRLIVEEPLARALAGPALAGAAWARRVTGWEGADLTALAALARRERVFLAAPAALPSREVLDQLDAFAIAVPDDWPPGKWGDLPTG